MNGPKKLRYEPSPKHCEPITAEAPGVKCPAWSRPIAQRLLEKSVKIGGKRYSTHNGVAFVGQLTRATAEEEVWHGYPEAWDRVDIGLKRRWLADERIQKRDLRQLKTRADVRNKFGGRLVE
jgi:hypothetical protein